MDEGWVHHGYLFTRRVMEIELPDFRTFALSPEKCRERAEALEDSHTGLEERHPRMHLWRVRLIMEHPVEET